MGMARRPAPTEALLSWGQAVAAPKGPCLPGGWSAAQVSWSTSSSAQLSGAHSAPSPGRTVLSSLIAQVSALPKPGSWSLQMGLTGLLLQATLRLDCARPLAGPVQLQAWCCVGGGQVGGSDVAQPPLPLPVPRAAASHPRPGAPQPFPINGPVCRAGAI